MDLDLAAFSSRAALTAYFGLLKARLRSLEFAINLLLGIGWIIPLGASSQGTRWDEHHITNRSLSSFNRRYLGGGAMP